jgi:hypothetical protein
MIEIADVPSAVTAPQPGRKSSAAQARAGMQGLINLALMIWMIWDLRHRSDEELNGKRKLWMLAAFAPPIGPIVYFIYLRRRRTHSVEIPLEIAA